MTYVYASIMADSINGVTHDRLTTFQVECPLWVWYDLLTHRLLSRNASSMRAEPFASIRARIYSRPNFPSPTTTYAKGMVSNEVMMPEHQRQADRAFRRALNTIMERHHDLEELGASKQDANTLLMPFVTMTGILSATEWANFFKLRCDAGARPAFQTLAKMMRQLYSDSAPKVLNPGAWHLPYIAASEDTQPVNRRQVHSVARCARVSWLKHDKMTATFDEDANRHEQLIRDGHWSPFEHQAVALPRRMMVGNYVGWLQYRKLFGTESGGDVNNVIPATAAEARKELGI